MSDPSARAVVDQCIIKQSLHILRFTFGLDPLDDPKDYDQQTIEIIKDYFERIQSLAHKITTEDKTLYESLLSKARTQGLFSELSKISGSIPNSTKAEPKVGNNQGSHAAGCESHQTSCTPTLSNTPTDPRKRKSGNETAWIDSPARKKVKQRCRKPNKKYLANPDSRDTEEAQGKPPQDNSNQGMSDDAADTSSDSEDNADHEGYANQDNTGNDRDTNRLASQRETLKAILGEELRDRKLCDIEKANALSETCSHYISALRDLSDRMLRMVLYTTESFIKEKTHGGLTHNTIVQALSSNYSRRAKSIHSRISTLLEYLTLLLHDSESFERMIDTEFEAMKTQHSAIFRRASSCRLVKLDKITGLMARQQMAFESLEGDWEEHRRQARSHYLTGVRLAQDRAGVEGERLGKVRDEKLKALREMSEGGQAPSSSSGGATSSPK